MDGLIDIFNCRCEDKYNIEPHGKGYAIYYGRCRHRHGYNLALITECYREDLIKYFEKCLNSQFDNIPMGE
jgi:hypothetical protein